MVTTRLGTCFAVALFMGLQPATAADEITQIIDRLGAGTASILSGPIAVATDASGNVYVAGFESRNVFEVHPDGTIIEIADSSSNHERK